MPYAPRATVLPLPNKLYAKPARGDMSLKLFLNTEFDRPVSPTNHMPFGAPGAIADWKLGLARLKPTSVPFLSMGGIHGSQRSPRFRVNRDVTFQSSCT